LREIIEYIMPQGAPIRGAGICDQPHAMPLHWSHARYRRIWRWARKSLRADEASLVEAVVLHGARTDALPVLKAALRKLAEHYAKFNPAEDILAWEAGVRRNLEFHGVPA
jgi:hypothetical protein